MRKKVRKLTKDWMRYKISFYLLRKKIVLRKFEVMNQNKAVYVYRHRHIYLFLIFPENIFVIISEREIHSGQ